MVWKRSATELAARGFRWRDGVKEVEFGDFRDWLSSLDIIEVPSFGECSNSPFESGCALLPSGLEKIPFARNCNIELHDARKSWPGTV